MWPVFTDGWNVSFYLFQQWPPPMSDDVNNSLVFSRNFPYSTRCSCCWWWLVGRKQWWWNFANAAPKTEEQEAAAAGKEGEKTRVEVAGWFFSRLYKYMDGYEKTHNWLCIYTQQNGFKVKAAKAHTRQRDQVRALTDTRNPPTLFVPIYLQFVWPRGRISLEISWPLCKRLLSSLWL